MKDDSKRERGVPTVSAVLDDGSLVEMVFDPIPGKTAFVVQRDGEWSEEAEITLPSGLRLIPYSPRNNLLLHEVVLLPSAPEEYGTEEKLRREIRAFIHRYVQLSPLFEEVASYYVLLSWLFDAFEELPYLRVQGDYGSGKSRFLLTVGAICYKPIFASGASTVSPIFRILDAVRGTLVIDEGDFRQSDEKAEIVKILNNGNARGFPVLRSEVTASKEINPQAFAVFGPKLVATRGAFEDRALESRCLTEEMGSGPLREDIALNLPAAHKEEALHLRNKLLLFRFRNHGKPRDLARLADRSIEPRLAQVFAPLISVVGEGPAEEELRALARRYSEELKTERGMDLEAEVLEVIRDLALSTPGGVSLKDIASWFADRHGAEYDRKISPRWIGGIIRRRLHLRPEKSHGNFIVPLSEFPKLPRLYERYGIEVLDGWTSGTLGTKEESTGEAASSN
jgi:hypothetical protein